MISNTPARTTPVAPRTPGKPVSPFRPCIPVTTQISHLVHLRHVLVLVLLSSHKHHIRYTNTTHWTSYTSHHTNVTSGTPEPITGPRTPFITQMSHLVHLNHRLDLVHLSSHKRHTWYTCTTHWILYTLSSSHQTNVSYITK